MLIDITIGTGKKMKALLPIILFSLSGCFSAYDYKDCGALYEQSVGSPLGNNGNFSVDSWGDAMTVMRGIPPDRFFQNNACVLTGKVEEQ